jgi:hypothetical protein
MSNWINKKATDNKIKSSLSYWRLRQSSLKDERDKRIPGTARWLWDTKRTPDEEKMEIGSHNKQYDRTAIGEGKTNKLSNRRAVKPERMENIGLGGWGNNPAAGHGQLIIGPHGPGGPAAVAAARYNLDRGEQMRQNNRWDPIINRIVGRSTGGPNPLLEQITDVGRKKAHTSEIAKNIGIQNKILRRMRRTQRMGVASERARTPTHLTDQIAQFEETPVSDLTKTGLGAPSQRKIGKYGRDLFGKKRKKPRHNGGKRKKTRKKSHKKTRRKSVKTRRKSVKTRRKLRKIY